MAQAAEGSGLLGAVRLLRDEVERARFPLQLPDAADARSVRQQLAAQLDDYVIPRLESLDAPLLAVVGGSTGAGKSTLVNSLVGAVVSPSGVLRPTTRAPVLVHHPQDAGWFLGPRILPGLARLTGAPDVPQPAAAPGDQPGAAVRLVPTEALQPGLALLDAPDIDSVVRPNRELARQLLAAADLWLFTTTAARYADAVPWGFLREAADRGTSVAIVLDRVPPEAMQEIRAHLAEMLRDQGLGSAPIFAVAEARLSAAGLLDPAEVAPLTSWLSSLTSDAAARADVVRRTLTGALNSLQGRVEVLQAASLAQVAASQALHREARDAYDVAHDGVAHGMSDGSLLRGEVLARWQEFVGTGEFLRQVEAGIGRLRDRISAVVRGQPPPAERLGEALQSGVAQLVVAHAQAAAAATVRQWRQLPGGQDRVDRHPELARPSPDLPVRVERSVRDWQGEILQLVRVEGKDRRTTARVLSFGVNGIGVVLMLVVFGHTAGLTGAEVGIAGGSALLAQRLLEAIFGDQAVRDLATRARQLLLEQVRELYAAELAVFDAAVADVGVDPEQGARLAAAAAAVRANR